MNIRPLALVLLIALLLQGVVPGWAMPEAAAQGAVARADLCSGRARAGGPGPEGALRTDDARFAEVVRAALGVPDDGQGAAGDAHRHCPACPAAPHDIEPPVARLAVRLPGLAVPGARVPPAAPRVAARHAGQPPPSHAPPRFG